MAEERTVVRAQSGLGAAADLTDMVTDLGRHTPALFWAALVLLVMILVMSGLLYTNLKTLSERDDRASKWIIQQIDTQSGWLDKFIVRALENSPTTEDVLVKENSTMALEALAEAVRDQAQALDRINEGQLAEKESAKEAITRLKDMQSRLEGWVNAVTIRAQQPPAPAPAPGSQQTPAN